MLAKIAFDNAFILDERAALRFFASKLTPTGGNLAQPSGFPMPQVDFYILPSADPLARLDFACKLTEKAWRMGHRIYLHCSDAAQRDELDARLWRFKGESFVPHGPAESEPESLVVLGLGG